MPRLRANTRTGLHKIVDSTMGHAMTIERPHNYAHGKSNPRLLALLQSQLPSWEEEERELNALLRKQRKSA